MQKKNKTASLPELDAERLRRAVGNLVIAMTNNAALLRAGYDLALNKSGAAKRVEIRVAAAHAKMKPELVKFVAELEDVVGCPMPWAFLGYRSRRAALACLRILES